MNFIKAVGKSINIVTLDTIVEDILKNHDKEMNAFVATREDFLSAEEAESIEAGWFAIRNQSYDKRVKNAVGKTIPENWQEDKCLTCVRKRILNRGLEKVKGQLLIRLAAKNETSKTHYLEVLKAANVKLSQQAELVPARFPVGPTELSSVLDLEIKSIVAEIKVSTPNMDKLADQFSDSSVTDPNLSWTAFQAKVDDTVARLHSHNATVVKAAINGLKTTAVENISNTIALAIQQEQERFLEALKEKNIVTSAEALTVNADLMRQLEASRVAMKKSQDDIVLSF